MEVRLILAAVIAILLVYLFVKSFIRRTDYWTSRGIPTVNGALPLIGHTLSILMSYKSFGCFCNDVYRANKGRSMIGYYQLRKPILMLLDPELVKTVLITDFSKFQENTVKADADLDPLLAENPFLNSGEKWKTFRSRLSYALMSGKRLRVLGAAVAKVCQKFTKFLRDKIEESKNGVYEVEATKLSNFFTGEVVSRAAFGVDGDFFANGSGPNSFREHVDGFLKPSLYNAIAFTILIFFPSLNAILRLSFLPKKMDRFFRRVVRDMIAIRRQDGIPRDDFLQLMLDKCEDENGKINEDSITANATSFFIDGYETSAITMSFFAHQLADNPAAQDKLRNEVKTVLEKHNGEISYESLKEMTYMDDALSESLRLYPAAFAIVKKCNERCKLVGKDGLECIVEPGTEITIPIHGFHKDSEYWENPEVYQPERFSDECKRERPKTVFLPFSEGPRICVGMRFAVMQIKGAIATIVKDFVIEPSPKTRRPLTFKRGSLLTSVEGGLWINLKPL